MTVEAAAVDTSTAIPAAIIEQPAGPVDDTAAMDAVWDRLVTNNGAERENGKFVSPDPEKRAAAEAAKETPLEGGAGGEAVDPSTVSTDVPLPANWQGKDALWAKLPADVKAEVAALQTEQHVRLSEMGREAAAYKPLQGVGQEVTGYLGRLRQQAEARGEQYSGPQTPAEGIAYLFNIQRQMDADAPTTILNIIDTYGVRDKIAALLGPAQQGEAGAREAELLRELGELKAMVRNSSDPARIEQMIDQKNTRSRHDEEVSRLASAAPLYSEIDPDDMVFFINKAWKVLGPDAAVPAVFDHAYKAAVEASPALRAKSGAATTAAEDAARKAEAAKRGTSVNVRSTSSTKPRAKSDDEAMEEVWDKLHS